jgi:hypothetical protein
MDVQMPVYLYDVTTATDTPRLVVTCRSPESATSLAARLNQMRDAGELDDDPFTAAAPRPAVVLLDVEPGSSVLVKGYRVDVEAMAAAVDAQGGGQGRAQSAPPLDMDAP